MPADGTILLVPAVATAGGLPSRLGKYEILMPLAAGGMARIYIGRATGIGSFERHIVLKLILPERANDHTAVQMFLDEARLAAALNHQNVAQVFEVGEDQGIHYLAMEYVHGQDLRALLAKAGGSGTRVPIELALTVVAGAASGLNHAHERRGQDGVPLGIVHRDVSPSNIMIGYDGSVKLLDFGIAKATQRSIETQSGIIKGKFAYMAPEQCRGRDVDKRSDVFSLGIILYEITTQHRCFRADSDFDTMHRIVTGDVVRPTRLVPNYPAALEAIVLKALAVDPAQRYQSADQLLEAVESLASQARMSLSTNALGRFMVEMFGDQPEPWLNAAARAAMAMPLQPRESTISNTNSSEPVAPVPPPPPRPGTPEPWTPSTILDLPRGGDAPVEDPPQQEWNAKSYPTVPPYQAPTGPVGDGRQSQPVIGGDGRQSQPQMLPPPPAGPPPIALVQPQAYPISQPPPFTTPPSGSGPAIKVATPSPYPLAQPQRGDLSYPRYEVGTSESVDSALQLKSNKKMVFIGLGVVGFVAIIVIAVAMSGKTVPEVAALTTDAFVAPSPIASGAEVKPAIVDPPIAPSATVDAAVAPIAAKPPDAAIVDPSGSATEPEEQIAIRIISDPPGADVQLDGQFVGMTPLAIHRKPGATATMLVHHKGFQDNVAHVDLGGDIAKTIVLKRDDKVAAAVVKVPVVVKEPKPPVVKEQKSTKRKCQPKEAVDPFDTVTPICK